LRTRPQRLVAAGIALLVWPSDSSMGIVWSRLGL
jgi:hypothetical protein